MRMTLFSTNKQYKITFFRMNIRYSTTLFRCVYNTKKDYVPNSGMDKRMLPYRRRLGDRRGNRQPLASASRGGRDGTVFHDPPSQTCL